MFAECMSITQLDRDSAADPFDEADFELPDGKSIIEQCVIRRRFTTRLHWSEKDCFIATGSPDRVEDSRSELRHKYEMSHMYIQNMCTHVNTRYITCQTHAILRK